MRETPVKRGTPMHPKTHELASLLGVRHVTVLGHLELLFHFTAQYAPEGNIGRYSDKRIAAGLEWPGKPEKLIESLVAAGWVDRDDRARLVVHDWSDHADRSTLQHLSRLGKIPLKPTQQDTENLCTPGELNIRTPCAGARVGMARLGSSSCISEEGKNSLSSEAWEVITREYPGKVRLDEDLRLNVSLVGNEHEKFRQNLEAWKNSRQWQRGFVESLGKFIESGQWKTGPPAERRPKSDRERLLEEAKGG